MAFFFHEQQAILNQADWKEIFDALKKSSSIKVAEKLAQGQNLPRPAPELFPDPQVYQKGQDNLNAILRRKGIPFRLGTIGHFEDRVQRLLAFVCMPLEASKPKEQKIFIPLDHNDAGTPAD